MGCISMLESFARVILFFLFDLCARVESTRNKRAWSGSWTLKVKWNIVVWFSSSVMTA